eukprot:GHVU01087944.1.p2 GENE.GHVU01087944.1~~GHVU01087944.1.p2  ORF type:complete len:120 (+),score=23.99 GHVU01087944.1:70-429(+)
MQSMRGVAGGMAKSRGGPPLKLCLRACEPRRRRETGSEQENNREEKRIERTDDKTDDKKIRSGGDRQEHKETDNDDDDGTFIAVAAVRRGGMFRLRAPDCEAVPPRRWNCAGGRRGETD